MHGSWFLAYLCLAALAVFQAALMVLHTWENRRFARNRIREIDAYHPTGHAAVFVPCKGAELGLKENLSALMRQDYPDYEVTFVVEHAGDPAATVIRQVIEEHPRRVPGSWWRVLRPRRGKKCTTCGLPRRRFQPLRAIWHSPIPTPGRGPSGCGR